MTINDFSFRNKRFSWIYYNILINKSTSTEYIGPYLKDPFLRGFQSDLYLRPACHNCAYTSMNRVSDITMADFWNYKPSKKADKNFKNLGVSLAIINTIKGEVAFLKATIS